MNFKLNLSFSIMLTIFVTASSSYALTCGTETGNELMPCGGPEDQFEGLFKPTGGYGGFGGGDCTANKTPIIYLHGN